MLYIIYVLLGLSLAAVLFTLVMGGRAMTSKNEATKASSNKWMWRRITAQMIAIGLLILLVMVKRSGG